MKRLHGIASISIAIAALLALAALGACASGVPSEGSSSAAPAVENTELKAQVEELIGTREGIVSVAYYSLAPDGEYFAINGDAPLVSASIIKLPILASLLKEAAADAIALDAHYIVKREDAVGGSGIGLWGGQELSISELAELMIAESDNTASNVIISLLGIDMVNQDVQELGLTHTLLARKFMAPEGEGENLTSANDIATVLRLIVNGELGNEELSSLAERYLLEQSDNDALPRGLPENMMLGHKAGALGTARSDGGIVYNQDGEPLCVLVVMSQGIGSGDAEVLIGKIASLVCGNL